LLDETARGTTIRRASITCALTGIWTAISMRYVMLPSLIVLMLSPLVGQEPTFDLSDQNCRGELLISVIEGARVYASCVSAGPERIMHVSVSNQAVAEAGPLRDFSIGFCGLSVIAASAKTGWTTKIEGDERHSVTWSLPDDLVSTLGIPSGARMGGFVVRLKPGWKRSRSDSAWWGESKIVAQATTHDCN
jgi:hypothetical protein